MTKLIPAIYEDGHLNPTAPLHLPEHQRVLIAITINEDDIPSLLIDKAAEESQSFQFLNNPREDIYYPSDGSPIE